MNLGEAIVPTGLDLSTEVHGSLPRTLSQSLIDSKRSLKRRFIGPVLAVGIVASCSNSPQPSPDRSLSAPSSPGSTPDQAVLGSSDQIPPEDPNALVLPFPRGETWYFNNGVHNLNSGIGSAIDIAPPERVDCEDDSGKPIYNTLRDRWVTASQSGTVTVVGPEDNREDRNHSLVQIQGLDGTSISYVHLDNIQVEAGKTVFTNDRLGNLSCEFPNSESGRTTGIHVHMAVSGGIDGRTFSGWKVDGDNLVAQDLDAIRHESTVRCPPNATSADCIVDGKKIRNDLFRGVISGDPNGVGGVGGPGETAGPIGTYSPDEIRKLVSEIVWQEEVNNSSPFPEFSYQLPDGYYVDEYSENAPRSNGLVGRNLFIMLSKNPENLYEYTFGFSIVFVDENTEAADLMLQHEETTADDWDILEEGKIDQRDVRLGNGATHAIVREWDMSRISSNKLQLAHMKHVMYIANDSDGSPYLVHLSYGTEDTSPKNLQLMNVILGEIIERVDTKQI